MSSYFLVEETAAVSLCLYITYPAAGQLPGTTAVPSPYLLALHPAPSYDHCPVPLGKGLQWESSH